MKLRSSISLALAFAASIDGSIHHGDLERFDEELIIRPIFKEHSSRAFEEDMAILSFQMDMRAALGSTLHYNLFPKTIGMLAEQNNLKDLHLSLSRGEWDIELWGEEMQPSPTGAELWASFIEQQRTAEGNEFDRLTRALSGLLCIEFNRMSAGRSVQPTWSTWDVHQYGILSRETSCNENLSHLLNLTPSRTQHGFTAVVKTNDVLSSPYHALGLRFRKLCLSPNSESVLNCNGKIGSELTLKLSFMVPAKSVRGWDRISGSKLARTSAIVFQRFDGSVIHRIPSLGATTEETQQQIANAFQICEIDEQNKLRKVSAVQVEKIVTEIRETSALFTIKVINSMPHRVQLRVVEIVPSFLRVRFNTLIVLLGSQVMSQYALNQSMNVTGGDAHAGTSSHTLLELDSELEAHSNLTITFRVDKRFLRLEMFPADPNRGMDVPPSLVWYREQPHDTTPGASKWKRTYSLGLLLLLPLPDFSMPYNVITLSSTTIAFVFGSFVNVLSRRRKVKGTEKKL